MKIIQFSRKNIFAVLAGFSVIILLGIITSVVQLFMTSHILQTVSATGFKAAFTQQPYITISWSLRTLSYLSPVIGGFCVGWLVGEKGWLYGGVLGVALKFVSIGIVSLYFFLHVFIFFDSYLPPQQTQGLAQQNILHQLLYSPITILFTAFGGYIGEHLHKNRMRKTF